MWKVPKTNWLPNDTYEIEEDLSRVEGNLHEIMVLFGTSAPGIVEKASWKKTDIPSIQQINRINSNILTALNICPVESVPPPELGETVDYELVNAWEANLLWMWRKLHNKSLLIEAGGAPVVDCDGSAVLCAGESETFRSKYDGNQIDGFIAKIKGWNHDRL